MFDSEGGVRVSTVVIFGGTGFIGLHFTKHLLDNKLADKVILADIKSPDRHPAARFLADEISRGIVEYEECDVRQRINLGKVTGTVALVANFAAVHREPGHASNEYYETNIPGAENVCAYAVDVNCDNILFTSSISPYGPTEFPKDEAVIPTPETAYGGSKLAA